MRRRWRVRLLVLTGVVALCAVCTLGFLALDRIFFPSGRAGCDVTFEPAQRAPCYVVADYYQAIAAQDWARAHGYLAQPQRAAITPEALRDDWARRRPVRAFRVELDPVDSQIEDAWALIVGRLTFRWQGSAVIGASLVREGDAWKIAGLTEDRARDQLPAGTSS